MTSATDLRLMEIVDEFVSRTQAGEHPSVAEYCDRFPDLADDLQELLGALNVLEDLRPESASRHSAVEQNLPERIGDYRIIDEIGRGGMGVVYEAEQESLGRRVALKVLPKSHIDPEVAKTRFHREARAAAKMHHTNIVPVFEVGRDGDHFFYAMQLIAGHGLAQIIDEFKDAALAGDDAASTLSPTNMLVRDSGTPVDSKRDSATDSVSNVSHTTSGRGTIFDSPARLGIQVAEALSYAHERGVIHRDIKPSNLLLDIQGVTWVTDFGLAKDLDDDATLTKSGDHLGTLRYMSPERFRGNCDERADIYALGLTLYELVLLTPAFEASDRIKLIYLISHTEPQRPRTVNPRIPRDLETIILKCIEKEPGRRYQRASDLGEDLYRFVNDRPIRARRASAIEDAMRWVRRNRAIAASLAAVALMTVVTIAVLLFSLNTAEVALDETREFAARALLTQADSAFEDQKFQTASLLALRSRDTWPSEAATAKLLSARASTPTRLRWVSPTLNDVTAMTHSRVGNFIAAASLNEDTIWIWDADSLQTIARLRGHSESIETVASHPQQNWLLSGAKDQSVRLWDAESGEQLWQRNIDATPADVAIDRTGKYAAAGGVFQGIVRIWNCATGDEIHHFAGRGAPVTKIDFSGDGNRLAAGFQDGIVQVWNLKTGHGSQLDTSKSISSLLFLLDDRLITADADAVMIHDLSNQQSLALGPDGFLAQNAVELALSPNETELAVAFASGELAFWNTSDLASRPLDRIQLGSPAAAVDWADSNHLVVATRNEGRHSLDHTIRIIDRATGENLASTLGHVRPPFHMEFTSNSSQLMTLADDRTIRIWDTKSGEVVSRLAGHRGDVRCASIAPNGNFVLSGGVDRTLRLWDVDSGDELAKLTDVDEPVIGAAWAHNSTLAAASTPTGIQIWHITETSDPKTSIMQSNDVSIDTSNLSADEKLRERTLVFTPNGEQLACGTTRGRVLIWSVESGKQMASHATGGRRPIRSIYFNRTGNRLAVHRDDFRATVYDVSQITDPQEVRTVEYNTLRSVTFAPSGECLVTGGYDPTVLIWRVASGRPISQVEGHHGRIQSIVFSPDERFLATASRSEIRLWELNSGETSSLHGSEIIADGVKWDDVNNMLFRFHFSIDEQQVLIHGHWGGMHQATWLDRITGRRIQFRDGFGGSIDPQNRWIAMCTKAGELSLTDSANEEVTPLPHDGGGLKSLVFNVDGSRLAGSDGGVISIWDPNSRTKLCSWQAHEGYRTYVLFHPTNPFQLVSASRDGMIYLWDISTDEPQRLRQFNGHTGAVGRIAFSRDGSRLVSGGYTETPHVLLWDVSSGRILQRFIGHRDSVADVDISPDGRWIVSASRDFTVRLWDVTEGTELRRFQDHIEDVFCVAFTRDGSQIVSASADGTLRYRNLKSDELTQSMTRDQLEAETGMKIMGDRISPIAAEARWQAMRERSEAE